MQVLTGVRLNTLAQSTDSHHKQETLRNQDSE